MLKTFLEDEMGKFMPFKKKAQSNVGEEDRLLPESPDAEVKTPKKAKKKKGKKARPHDSKTKDGKIGGMLKGSKGKKVAVPSGKGKRPVPPQFMKGKAGQKSMAAKAGRSNGSIAEDIFG